MKYYQITNSVVACLSDFLTRQKNNIYRRISTVTTIDDLGITFNKHLSFERHINKKGNNKNSLTGMIRRPFCISRQRNLFSCKTTHWIWSYCLESASKTSIVNMIENVKRSAPKLVPGMPGLIYREKLEKIDLLL